MYQVMQTSLNHPVSISEYPDLDFWVSEYPNGNMIRGQGKTLEEAQANFEKQKKLMQKNIRK